MKPFLRDVMVTVREANVPSLASQVAYSLIFAMPSILLIVALIAGQVDQYTGFAITEEVRHAIITTLPADVQQVMIGLLDDAMLRARAGPTTVSAIVSILVAMVMAGNGLAELSIACCTAAGIVDTRAEWLKRVIFTSTSVLIALVLIGAFALFFWGGDLVSGIGGYFGAGQAWSDIWHRLQLPVLMVIVFLGLSLLFMTGTGHYVFWHVAPGALIATLLWFGEVCGVSDLPPVCQSRHRLWRGQQRARLPGLSLRERHRAHHRRHDRRGDRAGDPEGTILPDIVPWRMVMRRTVVPTSQSHDSSGAASG